MIRKAGIRELQFPDTEVIIPCFAVAQKPGSCGRNLRVFSIIESFARRLLRQNSRVSLYFSLLAGNLVLEKGSH